MASTKTFVRQTTAPQPFFKSNEDILEKLKEAKDLTYNMDLDDLAKVQPLDETRSTKLCENDSLQSMDTFNFQRSLNKQCLAYMDTLHPGEQLAFVDEIASKLPPTVPKKKRKGKYVKKKGPKVLPPIEKVAKMLDDNVPTELLRRVRDEFRALPTALERRNYIMEYLNAEKKAFNFQGQHMSWVVMEALFGTSTTFLANIRRTRKCRIRHTRRNMSLKRSSSIGLNKEDIIVGFLKMVAQEFEVSPDKTEVQIPYAFQRTLYSTFIEFWMKEIEGNAEVVIAPPHESYFYKIWRERVPWLKLRAYHTFMMCDECVSLNDRLRLAKTPAEKDAVWKQKKMHLYLVKEERHDYAQRILLAKRRPDLYQSMTIDGSDNSSYGFPYFSQKTHATQRGYKVRSKLYAAILHGHFAAAFTYASNLEGGSNVTVEIIDRMIGYYLNDAPGNKLPPTLWLQLDNTCRDNKNRYVFAFCQSLVDMGLFQEIEINFLPVGHTHCDIDQLFSRISVHLYGNNCLNFRDLLRKARMACSMIKYTEHLRGFADWKYHCLYHRLIVSGTNFKGYQKFRQFRFVRKEERGQEFRTLFQARKTVFHKYWGDLEGNIGGHIPLALKKLDFKNVFGFKDLRTLDYVADALKVKDGHDPIQAMRNGVLASQPRLEDLLGHAEAEAVVNDLLAEIKLQTTNQIHDFCWDLEKYKYPSIAWDPLLPFVLRAECNLSTHPTRAEAEAIIRLEDAGGAINTNMATTNVGDYVIVCPNLACDTLKRPFWVARVSKNNVPDKQLQVSWLLPPTKHSVKKKGNSQARFPFLSTTYVSPAHVPPERAHKKQQPNTQCVIRNYPYAQFKAHLDVNTNIASHSNRGERKIVNPTSWIDYDTIYFSFPHLGIMNDEHDCLPSNVLDAISLEPSIDWMG